MGKDSKIEWTDATWTPIRAMREEDGKIGVHCEKVSPACKNCYAERLNMRNLPAHGTGFEFTGLNRNKVEIICDEKLLMDPIRWKLPRIIFVCSQTDLFGEFVEEYQIAQVFAVMALAHWHTFQVLTKRAERMRELLSSEDFWEQVDAFMTAIVDGEVDPLERRRDDLRATAPEVSTDAPLPNVWLGVSAENQEWADKRMPSLLATPAFKRFSSCEPLLGSIRLPGGLDWVIAGGESGPGARPTHPDWVRSLRDQCQKEEVAFHFKQWGEWLPMCQQERDIKYPNVVADGANGAPLQGYPQSRVFNWPDGLESYRAGKVNAGRFLDGREWNGFPL